MSQYHRLHNEEHLLIRPIAPDDDDRLHELRQLLTRQFETVALSAVERVEENESVSFYRAYQVAPEATPDRGYWVLVDERENRVLGGIGFAARQQESDSRVCELQHLYLHPQLHGRGAGRKLVEYCMNQAARLGYRQMYLESAASPQHELDLNKNSGMRFFRTGRTVKITGILPS